MQTKSHWITVIFTDKTNTVFLGLVTDHLGNCRCGGLKNSTIVYMEHDYLWMKKGYIRYNNGEIIEIILYKLYTIQIIELGETSSRLSNTWFDCQHATQYINCIEHVESLIFFNTIRDIVKKLLINCILTLKGKSPAPQINVEQILAFEQPDQLASNILHPVLSTYSKLNNKDLHTQSTGIFSAEDRVLLQSRLKGDYVTVEKR